MQPEAKPTRFWAPAISWAAAWAWTGRLVHDVTLELAARPVAAPALPDPQSFEKVVAQIGDKGPHGLLGFLNGGPLQVLLGQEGGVFDDLVHDSSKKGRPAM